VSPQTLLVLPIVLPLATAIATLLMAERVHVQRAVSLLGAALQLAAAAALLAEVRDGSVLATQIGGWTAPFGITLVADLLAAVMVVLGALMGLAVAAYSPATLDAGRQRFGYYPLLHVLLMGVSGAFLTGDLFNLYVWFEVMLMASFVLLALGGERAQLRGAIAYVTLSLLSSALFLSGVGLLYAQLGSLNMADLAVRMRAAEPSGALTATALLFLVAFSIKAAAFPLFYWLPASYHTPPAAVSAIFAGLLTKVGVYALLRVFTLVFAPEQVPVGKIVLVVSGLTMLTGVLGAAAQGQIRRILSFHIVSQIGYMLMGLAIGTPLALAGTVFYLIHHIVVKTNLFLVAGVVERLRGTGDLKRIGGLAGSRSLLALLFLVPALSLAGLPPLSGFWAKLLLVKAGLDTESWTIVATALVVSLLTLYSMTKIWAEAFWKADPEPAPTDAGASGPTAHPLGATLVPIAALALVTIAIGLAVEPVYRLSLAAAQQLTDPSAYLAAVLGRP
jgi:multicomponent Na+:H+ antiporter subunit D